MQTTATQDVVRNEQPDEADRRARFIASLRECATFLESHPAVTAPRYVVMNVFVTNRADIVRHAKASTWEKVYNDVWFYLQKSFGDDLTLEINTSRETVCRKVVKGTRVVPAQPEHTIEDVEWVCESVSLLNEPSDA